MTTHEGSPTRLLISTPKPQASTMLGKQGSFDGICNLTQTGRFTAWSGANAYVGSKRHTYITGTDDVRIVAGSGVSISPDSPSSESDDDSHLSSNSAPESLFGSGDGAVGFTMLKLLGTLQSIGGLLNSPPTPLRLLVTSSTKYYGAPLLPVVGLGLGLGIPFGSGVMAPFAIPEGGKGNLKLHAKSNLTQTAKGNISMTSLGSFSASSLVMLSLGTPGLASMTAGLSASVSGALVAGISSIFLGTEVASRSGTVEACSMNNDAIVRGTRVLIGSPDDDPCVPPSDLVGLDKYRTAFLATFGSMKVKKATNSIQLRATNGVSVNSGIISLVTTDPDDEGTVRIKTDSLSMTGTSNASLEVCDASLTMNDEQAVLQFLRAPDPTRTILEEQRETLDTVRETSLEAADFAKKKQLEEAAVALGGDPLGALTPPPDDMAEAAASIEEVYQTALKALEEAHRAALENMELLVSSGVKVTQDEVILHAGATHITMDTSSGVVTIEQTAPGSPMPGASITLDNGAITLSAQTTVSIEAGGQSFSFGPTGYSGPNLTELP
jgi:hypothetical protein